MSTPMLLAQNGLTRKEHAISSARHWIRHRRVPFAIERRHKPLLIEANSVMMEFLLTFSTLANLHVCIAGAVDTSRSHERPQ